MRWIGWFAIVSSLLAGDGLRAQQPGSLAIRNVTVIVGDGSPPLAEQTVLIRGERIAAVGPVAAVAVPDGTAVIDGANRFLMPGLIGLHVHLSKARGSALGLFILNGVTTVRDMGGDFDELLRWRREVDAGKRRGPRMLIAGPYFESTGNIARMRKDPPEARIEPFERTRIGVGSPAEAHRTIADLASRGVDLIKIRTVQNHETYMAPARAGGQAMSLSAGTRLGPYEILSALGASGMVYRIGNE